MSSRLKSILSQFTPLILILLIGWLLILTSDIFKIPFIGLISYFIYFSVLLSVSFLLTVLIAKRLRIKGMYYKIVFIVLPIIIGLLLNLFFREIIMWQYGLPLGYMPRLPSY